MAGFIATLEPIDFVFLAIVLMSALDFLVWTFWLSLKGEHLGRREPLAFTNQPVNRANMIFQMVLGFTMTFGVAGLALRGLAGAEPLWALLGALAAGVMMGVLVWSLEEKSGF